MQAKHIGEIIRNTGFQVDYAFTSELSRNKEALSIILNEIGRGNIPVQYSWLLNAKHLGALTGLNKEEAFAQYSLEQVDYWTNNCNAPAPVMEEFHKYYHHIREKFAHLENYLPNTESYTHTHDRILKFWQDTIIPLLKKNEVTILILCHESTLETIKHYLQQGFIDDNIIADVKTPFYYELDKCGRPLFKIGL